MRILIIKLSSIGDCVHTLPALYALKEGFLCKDAKVDWLVEEAASSVLKGHPLIDEVIVSKRGWRRSLGYNLNISRYLKSKKYDIVIDFQGLAKSAIWVLLSGGRRKVGFSNARELSHLFLNDKALAYDPDMHAVDRYMELSRLVSGYGGEVVFPVHIDSEAGARVASLLSEAGISKGEPFIVLFPVARWATKLWTVKGFLEVTRAIINRFAVKVVFAGATEDREYLGRIIKIACGGAAGSGAVDGGVVDLTGKTGLMELAALLRLSRLVVTVDTGPMHIASAVGTPVVALFGPTAPWRTGPYGDNHIVIRKALSCSPCFKRVCPTDNECMRDITTEEVLGAIGGLLVRGK